MNFIKKLVKENLLLCTGLKTANWKRKLPEEEVIKTSLIMRALILLVVVQLGKVQCRLAIFI